jgi:hypothetical protein
MLALSRFSEGLFLFLFCNIRDVINESDNRKMGNIPIDEIIKSIRSIRFGQVQITIHNSDVVQIEQIERIRFDVKSSNNKSESQPLVDNKR